MKTIKADLSNEGRLDILEMVRAYRGGTIPRVFSTISVFSSLTVGYTREVDHFQFVQFRWDQCTQLQERRKIEQEAFSGQLLGIIATNALELGIDIGTLDAVIMLGFPFTVSNFVRSTSFCILRLFLKSRQKQQAGRAGRRSRDSLAIMVADPFPIDQHYVQNPDELFEHTLDDLIIDTDNEVILEGKLVLLPRLL